MEVIFIVLFYYYNRSLFAISSKHPVSFCFVFFYFCGKTPKIFFITITSSSNISFVVFCWQIVTIRFSSTLKKWYLLNFKFNLWNPINILRLGSQPNEFTSKNLLGWLAMSKHYYYFYFNFLNVLLFFLNNNIRTAHQN